MCDFSAVHTHDFAAIRCSAGPEKKEDKDYLDEQQKQLKRFKKKVLQIQITKNTKNNTTYVYGGM